jgi:hypothetical protein
MCYAAELLLVEVPEPDDVELDDFASDDFESEDVDEVDVDDFDAGEVLDEELRLSLR